MAQYEYSFGLHAAHSLLQHDYSRVFEVLVLEGRNDQRLQHVLDLAQTQALPVQRVPRKTLDKLAEGGNHQGVVLRCKAAEMRGESELAEFLAGLGQPPLLLVLDGVQDPHNLGACLRSADAAGAHAVIIPKDRASGLSPVVRKVACGAADSVPVFQVTNLARSLRSLQEAGVWLAGAEAGEGVTESLFTVEFPPSLALVLGAEGEGMRRLTREHCDVLFRIPMAGQVQSLNVSAAAAVCLYEAMRRRAAHR